MDDRWEVRVYLTQDGKSPFETWLQKLRDTQARARIRLRLDRMRLGNLGDHKPVGEGVCELRIPYGPGYRVYFGREGQRVILLLCGGDKSSQSKDIESAKNYWADYRRRNDGEE